MMHYTRPSQYHAGFNLIELMVVVILASILTIVAVPSFKSIQLKARVSSNISSIKQAIFFARNMAINYGARVTVCPLNNGKCVKDWSKGFSIFTDTGTTNQLDHQDVILQEIPPFNEKDIVQYNRLALRYQPDGLASGTNGTLTYCPEAYDSPYSQALVINQAGKIRLSTKKKIICKK